MSFSEYLPFTSVQETVLRGQGSMEWLNLWPDNVDSNINAFTWWHMPNCCFIVGLKFENEMVLFFTFVIDLQFGDTGNINIPTSFRCKYDYLSFGFVLFNFTIPCHWTNCFLGHVQCGERWRVLRIVLSKFEIILIVLCCEKVCFYHFYFM